MQYALQFWKKNPNYIILYNSDHAINVPARTNVEGFLPIALFGEEHITKSFGLSKYYIQLLKRYLDFVS